MTKKKQQPKAGAKTADTTLKIKQKFGKTQSRTSARSYMNYPPMAKLIGSKPELDALELELDGTGLRGHKNRLQLQGRLLEILAHCPKSRFENEYVVREVELRDRIAMALTTETRSDRSLPIVEMSFRKMKASKLSEKKQGGAVTFLDFLREEDAVVMQGTSGDIYTPTFLGSILDRNLVTIKVRGKVRGTCSLYHAVCGMAPSRYESLLNFTKAEIKEAAEEAQRVKAAKIESDRQEAERKKAKREKARLRERLMEPLLQAALEEEAARKAAAEEAWVGNREAYAEAWDMAKEAYANLVAFSVEIDTLLLSFLRKDVAAETTFEVFKTFGNEIYLALVDVVVENDFTGMSRPQLRSLVDSTLLEKGHETLFADMVGYTPTASGTTFLRSIPKIETFNTLGQALEFLDQSVFQEIPEVRDLKSQLQVPVDPR
tara:strand:+ start:11970 stop:13265 length:1296 start_codon:yes stop_codon:yes gene_type:complete